MGTKSKAYLIVGKVASGLQVKGCGEHREIPLGDGTVVIGRPTVGSVPEISISGDQRISRQHIYLSYDPENDCFVLCDHKSKWGTYLNYEPLEKGKEHALEPGDIIGLAETDDGILVEFRFVTSLEETMFEKGLVIRIQEREAFLDGEPLHIDPVEWRVLEVLYNNRRKTCSAEKIMILGWPDCADSPKEYPEASTIAQYIHRLREKVEPDPDNPRYIVTEPMPGQERKRGYKLDLQ